MKSIRLTGKGLEIAERIAAVVAEEKAALEEVHRKAARLNEIRRQECARGIREALEHIGADPNLWDKTGVDIAYLAEHGIAFLKVPDDADIAMQEKIETGASQH